MRRIKLKASKPTRTRMVDAMERIYIPPPQASPIAAVTHRPAAVVRPRTTFSLLWKMMVPAPMKPIPETTWAATRDTSHLCSGVCNSYHPEFMQIIEEGFINRLGFIPLAQENNYNAQGQNGNNFMDDDDDGFSIM